MQVSGTSTSSAALQAAAAEGSTATLVLKKVLDQQQVQAAQLAEMVAQAGGVGRNVSTYA